MSHKANNLYSSEWAGLSKRSFAFSVWAQWSYVLCAVYITPYWISGKQKFIYSGITLWLILIWWPEDVVLHRKLCFFGGGGKSMNRNECKQCCQCTLHSRNASSNELHLWLHGAADVTSYHVELWNNNRKEKRSFGNSPVIISSLACATWNKKTPLNEVTVMQHDLNHDISEDKTSTTAYIRLFTHYSWTRRFHKSRRH